MVQTALLFLLGFLTATLLAMAVAPAIWRRAGELTRRQIEASTPLTLNEVLADKDQLRAEFAVALRKIEIKAKQVNAKLTEQKALTASQQESLRSLEKVREVLQAELQARGEQLEEMRKVLNARTQELSELGIVRSKLDSDVASLNEEVTRRDTRISELKIDADNRRIELVAKATEQDQLNGRLRDLNLTRKSLEEKLRLTSQEMRVLQENSRKETKRIAELERQAERLISQLSDREERLERRENELARTKIAAKTSSEELNALKRQLFSVNQRTQQLERENAQIAGLKTKLLGGAGAEAAEKTMKKFEEEQAKLVAMVAQLTKEKDELVSKLKSASGAAFSQVDEDAKLRVQMHELTAKVVSLTEEAEGAQSPITRLLQTANTDAGANTAILGQPLDPKFELPVSLAERVKALQKSAQRS